MADHVSWTLKIDSLGSPPTTARWHSGEGTIRLDDADWTGATVNGAAVLGIDPVEQTQGLPNRRAKIRLAVVPEMVRRLLQQDYGPLPVEIGWIKSTDGGLTWERLPRLFRGRLSAPHLQNGLYTADIETVLGDVDRGEPLRWSFESYRARTQDTFFEAAASYAGGISFKWPP